MFVIERAAGLVVEGESFLVRVDTVSFEVHCKPLGHLSTVLRRTHK